MYVCICILHTCIHTYTTELYAASIPNGHCSCVRMILVYMYICIHITYMHAYIHTYTTELYAASIPNDSAHASQ